MLRVGEHHAGVPPPLLAPSRPQLPQHAPYIQSRYYRAPEVLLGAPYALPIDMWSLGCLLAELWLGRPLFAGRDSVEQLYAIMDVLGPPPEALLARAVYLPRYFRLAPDRKLHPKHKFRWRRQALWALLAHAKPWEAPPHVAAFHDLLARLLQLDPALRPTPAQALEHAFILHGPASRPAPQPAPPQPAPAQGSGARL